MTKFFHKLIGLARISLVTAAGALLGPGAMSLHARAQDHVRVGWCATSLDPMASPWAVAKKMGWMAEENLDVELVKVASGTDCAKFVATGKLPFALVSIEPVAGLVLQGADLVNYFAVYQGAPWGINVPANSNIDSVADLKGKRIGVLNLSSIGSKVVPVMVKEQGLDPDTDIQLVPVSSIQNAALMLKNREVDAVSIWDTAHMQIENLGVDLRDITTESIKKAPSLGLTAKASTLKSRSDIGIRLARTFAKGTAFAVSNPEAAVKILYEVYPETQASSKAPEKAFKDDIALMNLRMRLLSKWEAGAEAWGKHDIERTGNYLNSLAEFGMLSAPLEAGRVITDKYISEINNFDDEKIRAEAKAY